MAFGSVPPLFYIIAFAVIICIVIYAEWNSRS